MPNPFILHMKGFFPVSPAEEGQDGRREALDRFARQPGVRYN